MPLYEYQCQQCHKRVEKIQKFSDAPLTLCPHCGGALERTLTAPAIQFKGSGWYKDLYSSPKPPSSTGTAAGESSASSGGGDAAAAPASGDKSASATPAATAPASSPAPSPGSSGSSS